MSLILSKRLSLKRFTKGIAAHQSAIKLNHRRIFILPNRGGLSLVAVILLMLIASINYSNSMGFVFTFLLTSAAQVSALYSFKNLSGLTVSQAKMPVFHAGSNGQIKLMIKDAGGRERWGITAAHLAEQTSFNVQKGQSLLITLPTTFQKRGWHTLDTITLSTSFPFGFFRAWSPLFFNQSILVYPQPFDTGLPLESDQYDDEQSGVPSHQAGTDDFAGLKPYQKGHNYRQINWKALAAEKGLYSNNFNAEKSNSTWIDWQSCEHLDIEAKISQLCFWVLHCESHDIEYGLRLPNLEILPNHGDNHQHACLKALALYE